jgi:hypothetical protein
LLIDNGSANTWIKDYTLTSSSVPTGQNASVEYGIGEYAGQQCAPRPGPYWAEFDPTGRPRPTRRGRRRRGESVAEPSDAANSKHRRHCLRYKLTACRATTMSTAYWRSGRRTSPSGP